MRRAVSQSLLSAARVISDISRGISFEATEIIPTPPSAISGKVTASSPDNTAKVFRNGIADFSHLTDVAAGFLDSGDVRDLGQPRQRAGLDVRAGAARDVIKNDGLVHGFRDGAEVPVLSFLRRLVVVRRSREDAIDPGQRGQLLWPCSRHPGSNSRWRRPQSVHAQPRLRP